MQVRLLLPFFDMRRLNQQQTKYAVAKPNWPSLTSKSPFVRCLGGSDSEGTGIKLHRGLSFSSATISKMQIVTRKLIFPFANEILGTYTIVIDFPGIRYRKMKAEDIVDYLRNNLDISVRILFGNPKVKINKNNNKNNNNAFTRIKTDIYKLNDALREQYYLSTVKFKEIDPTTGDRVDLIDPTPGVSKQNIYFLTPAISVDNSNLADSKLKKH